MWKEGNVHVPSEESKEGEEEGEEKEEEEGKGK